jgi:phosphoserine aminotransferase
VLIYRSNQRTNKKAEMLYNFLDQSKQFIPYVSKENRADRSAMNVVFNLKDSSRELAVIAKVKEAGMMGIEGYRTIGGFRVSLYNAIQVEDVEKLVAVLTEFDRNGN